MLQDIFVPTSRPDDAIVRQLHTVTWTTSDKETVERALVTGYGLVTTGWQRPSPDELVVLNDYFGFEPGDSWEACAFTGSNGGENVQVRVIHVDDDAPMVRPSLDGFSIGGATISCPIDDLAAHERGMREIGMSSTIGIKEMEFTGPNGEAYVSAEIIYPAPENVYLLGVRRPDGFVPVGPMDAATGIGGPAYSARNVASADAVIGFLDKVLGFEIRRDVVIPIGERSALLLPEGAEERFVQAFAPGASTGYLVLMDHGKDNRPSPANTIGPPSRGIVMWTFTAPDLDVVLDRANAAETEILSGPDDVASPFLPGTRTLLLRDPEGFPIEICEA